MMLRNLFRLALCGLAATCLFAKDVSAESYASIMDRRPELFDSASGYRIARHRAPTPDDIPGAIPVITADDVPALTAEGALLLDVFGATQSRFDELDGTWLVSKEHLSLPGAIWLPETGRGVLEPQIARFLEGNLETATGGDKDHPIVVFCIADCWMSWNAAQRLARLGYTQVFWFRTGTDGWLDAGRELAPVDPIPVNVD